MHAIAETAKPIVTLAIFGQGYADIYLFSTSEAAAAHYKMELSRSWQQLAYLTVPGTWDHEAIKANFARQYGQVTIHDERDPMDREYASANDWPDLPGVDDATWGTETTEDSEDATGNEFAPARPSAQDHLDWAAMTRDQAPAGDVMLCFAECEEDVRDAQWIEDRMRAIHGDNLENQELAEMGIWTPPVPVG